MIRSYENSRGGWTASVRDGGAVATFSDTTEPAARREAETYLAAAALEKAARPFASESDVTKLQAMSAEFAEAVDRLRAVLAGVQGLDRIRHRTLVEINGIEGHPRMAVAIVPGWEPQTPVRFPLALMHDPVLRAEIEATISTGVAAYVFARVNIGALDAQDLHFEDFERTETPAQGEDALDRFEAEFQTMVADATPESH